MFNFFGSKRKLAHLYPKPRYPLIIEPFAGSAGYACLHRTRQVLLNDVDPVITSIWEWIINASADDIRAIPDIRPGSNLDDYDLVSGVRNLLGFTVNRGKAQRANMYQGWAVESDDVSKLKQRLLEMDFSHWRITHGDYTTMPNVEATWFIDPPYEKEGAHYKHHAINYVQLAEWCRTRKGQVMVCASESDAYLPFRVFARQHGRNWTTESIWTSD